MKNRIVPALLLILMLCVFSGCGQRAAQTAVPAEQQTAQTQAPQPAAELTDALIEKINSGSTEGVKAAFLTFDDGPGEHTQEVLDILAQNGVKATFFVNYHPDFAAQYQAIVDAGHTLANHSASHDYGLYNNPDAFLEDLNALKAYEKQTTGTDTTLMRFPGGSLTAGSANTAAALAAGWNYADWNVSTGDAAPETPSPEQILANVLTAIDQDAPPVAVILCHGEHKDATRAALPDIISSLRLRGYTFYPMSEKISAYPRQM